MRKESYTFEEYNQEREAVIKESQYKEKYKNALKEIKEHCRVYLRPKHKREYDEKMGGYFASNIEEIINEVLNA